MTQRNGRALAYCILAAVVSLLVFSGCNRVSPFQERPGESVLYGDIGSFKGFEPIDAGDVVSATHVGNVYEGLVEYSYLERPYKVVPVLCEEVPTMENGGISADGLTYTFKIRRGIRFHDDRCFLGRKGREVTARDFVYSFKRLMDSSLQAQGDWIFNGHVIGVDDFAKLSGRYFDPRDPTRSKLYEHDIEGFQAVNDDTLIVKLTKPYPQLLWVLTMSYAFAVPREAVEYYDGKKHEGEAEPRPLFRNHPVGTGAWILKTWDFGYRMEYVRNPNYRGVYPRTGEPGDEKEGLLDDGGKKLPICDRMICFDIREASARWHLFLSGDLPNSGINKDYFQKIINPKLELTPEIAKRNIRLYKTPELQTDYVAFNFNDPVVGRGVTPEESERHRKLRQAVACAINTKRLIEVLLNGQALQANGPIPPGIAGRLDGAYEFEHNPDRARKLLAEAGYPDGKDAKTGRRLKLTMDTAGAGSTEGRQRAELYTEMLRDLGIELEVRAWSFTEYLRRTKQGETQMFTGGWVIDYPDAQNFLQLFYGPNKAPGINGSNYQNPEFDRLYEQILPMPDSPERTAIYEKMSRMVVEDCVWVMGDYPMSFTLFQPWFANYKSHDFPYANNKFYKVRPH